MESDDRDTKRSVVLPAGMELVVPPPAREEFDERRAATAAVRPSGPPGEIDGSVARDGAAGARP